MAFVAHDAPVHGEGQALPAGETSVTRSWAKAHPAKQA